MEKPSSMVFDAAKKISEDMREAALDAEVELVDWLCIFSNMAQGLGDVKKNLERHALRMAKRGSPERHLIRQKITSIQSAMSAAERIWVALDCTRDEIREAAHLNSDTNRFLEKIMHDDQEPAE